jgi:DNA-binding MarR family transcriptional regulator
MKITKERLFKELHLINHLSKRHMRRKIRSMGLKEVGHPFILKTLSEPENNGQMDNQKDLAEILSISPAAIAQSIKRMEHEGLLRKINDETDLRVNQIAITEKGRAYVQQIDRGLAQLADKFFTDFSDLEKQQYHAFNLRIIENLKQSKTDQENFS